MWLDACTFLSKIVLIRGLLERLIVHFLSLSHLTVPAALSPESPTIPSFSSNVLKEIITPRFFETETPLYFVFPNDPLVSRLQGKTPTSNDIQSLLTFANLRHLCSLLLSRRFPGKAQRETPFWCIAAQKSPGSRSPCRAQTSQSVVDGTSLHTSIL